MPETAVFFFTCEKKTFFSQVEKKLFFSTSEKKQCVHTTPHMGVLPHKGEPQIEALEEH